MQIIEHPTEFHIRIEYDRFKITNENKIKKIDGSKFSWAKKVWVVPYSKKQELEEVQKQTRAEWIVLDNRPEIVGAIPPMPDLDFDLNIVNSENGYKPRPYQLQGIARGLELKMFINGDEQGLGKTLQSLATIYAAHLKGEDVFPCVVVCPSTTKINWQREWKMWTGIDALILEDKNKDTWNRFYEMGLNKVFIVNYESLKKYFVKSMPKGRFKSSEMIMDERIHLFKSIIIDEIHRLKNPSSQQTKIALRLAVGKKYRIGLTGTLVPNRPIEALPQLAIIGKLKSEKVFKERYCAGGSGASNLKELNYMLYQHCYFRREKKEVAKDLPEKQRQTILCSISNQDEYDKAKNDFTKWLAEQGCDDADIAKKLQGEIMVKMGALKQISAKGKLKEVKDFVQDIVDSGEKIILFANLHSIVDEVIQLFPGAVEVTGRLSQEEKQRSIDSFQNNSDVKVIVCNIKAAGVGITLTASSRVAFIEYPWTYADCAQCEDRAHRIGQKNTVMCTYFLGNNTIDEYMYNMIQQKRHIGNTITGATDNMEMTFVDNVINLFKT
ncbi:DEAD/DEAH box helicase [Flavobacterium oreochromis]|uniref:DEAD/DEAH box helicase n=1 Tax=Flavobacterium oreochromis TaxID=2906078 RepID=UPI001CE619BB|nr:DEAD/DEAH box helicase [Flavobacterium oreochromis]QYS85439.1 DEAD/DEAH box helicase [Flavobacterium oreochromis]